MIQPSRSTCTRDAGNVAVPLLHARWRNVLVAGLLAAGAGAPLLAADVETWTPPGGNFEIHDSTGAVLRLLVNGSTGDVQIPRLPSSATQTSALCFNAVSGLLGQCDAPPVGPAGPAGPAGTAGPAGPAGTAGAQGLVGPAGADGDDGLAGPVGPAGSPGPAGADGLVGPAGAAGPQGPVGPAGPAGTNGDVGVSGPPGPAGPAGPQGLEGPVGPVGPQGPAGTPSAYAEFFALMPPDNAATVAIGDAVDFPQDGEIFGGIARLSPETFVLPSSGVYQVMFQVSVTEAGQLMLALDNVELPQTAVGRATGTSQIVGLAFVRANAGQVLSVRNPAGNSTALTITPLAGGTRPVSAHLTIVRIGD